MFLYFSLWKKSAILISIHGYQIFSHSITNLVEQRRNYKGVFDGLIRIVREEGFTRLFRGVEWAAQRTALVTVGQIAFYDATKDKLIQTGYFDDNIATHFTASIFAGTVATFLSQP